MVDSIHSISFSLFVVLLLVALHKKTATPLTRSQFASYLAYHRYPCVAAAFDRIQLFDSGPRSIFTYGARLFGVTKPKSRVRGGGRSQSKRGATSRTEIDRDESVPSMPPTSNWPDFLRTAKPAPLMGTLVPREAIRYATIPLEVSSIPAVELPTETNTKPSNSASTIIFRQPRGKRKAASTLDDTPTDDLLRSHHDPDHVRQPVDIPFRRSTSQEEQKREVLQGLLQDDSSEAGAEDSDDEEEATAARDDLPTGRRIVSLLAPSPSPTSSNQIDAIVTSTPSRKRAKSTRVRWTPEEDQHLIQLFNEWFVMNFTPGQGLGGMMVPRSSPPRSSPGGGSDTNPSSPPVIQSVNIYVARKMSGRDAAACRRRLEVLRHKGMLPAFAAIPLSTVRLTRASIEEFGYDISKRSLTCRVFFFFFFSSCFRVVPFTLLIW